MNSFGTLILTAWIPATFLLFLALPKRNALLLAVIGGWCFLPCGSIHFPGLPDFNKQMVTCLGPFIAALMTEPKRVARVRWSWRDLPALTIVVCPLASSLTNDLGLHDGLSEVFEYLLMWGVPYVLGRIYLSDGEGLRALGRAVLISGIVYVPLCLFEVRMSPQLHNYLYGFISGSFEQARYGTYRPSVFMINSLTVGAWMMAASLVGCAMSRFRMVRPPFALPVRWIVVALVVTTILCKTIGAIVLMLVGSLVYTLARRQRARWLLVVLVAFPQLFVASRVSGLVNRATLQSAFSFLPEDRGESLDYRAKNEDVLVEKALKRPLFGWGGWGRSRIVNEEGDDVSIVDSIWVLILGKNGLVGLVALMGLLLVGPATFLARTPTRAWTRHETVPAFCFALIATFFAIDCTLNALINPVMLMAIGGIVGFRPAAAPAVRSATIAAAVPAR
jgi:hypothetical protein